MTYYFYDENRVRYQLYRSKAGMAYNWLFFPGGPGADSRYLTSLIDTLDIPGNAWLIDLPGNGDNTENLPEGFSFDKWLEILPTIPARFQNPIYVGHSFGGIMPLLFPELGQTLTGLVLLNTTPSLWFDAAREAAQKFQLPDLTSAMNGFTQNPMQVTFENALSACLPYYFPKKSLGLGSQLLSGLPFPFQVAAWGQMKAAEMCSRINWIPNNLPTMIVGGEYDAMTPFTLFRNDPRFKLPNINMFEIMGAGHMPWVEQPQKVCQLFQEFARKLSI